MALFDVMEGDYVPRSGKAWGPETAAGQRILATIAAERGQRAEQSASGEPTSKRRRTRWAPQAAVPTIAVPGIPGVELPEPVAAIAATLDMASAALQQELIRVRAVAPSDPALTGCCVQHAVNFDRIPL